MFRDKVQYPSLLVQFLPGKLFGVHNSIRVWWWWVCVCSCLQRENLGKKEEDDEDDPIEGKWVQANEMGTDNLNDGGSTLERGSYLGALFLSLAGCCWYDMYRIYPLGGDELAVILVSPRDSWPLKDEWRQRESNRFSYISRPFSVSVNFNWTKGNQDKGHSLTFLQSQD